MIDNKKSQADITRETFFKLYYPGAVISQRNTGVPALATLAQAALESGWGDRAPGFAFFGIKADRSWKGKKQLLTTTEIHSDGNRQNHPYPEIISINAYTDSGRTRYRWKVKDYFRAYDNAAESFTDHAQFLKVNPRYATCFGTTDPVEFVRRVAAAGYATSPDYAKILTQIISSLQKLVPSELPAK